MRDCGVCAFWKEMLKLRASCTHFKRGEGEKSCFFALKFENTVVCIRLLEIQIIEKLAVFFVKARNSLIIACCGFSNFIFACYSDKYPFEVLIIDIRRFSWWNHRKNSFSACNRFWISFSQIIAIIFSRLENFIPCERYYPLTLGRTSKARACGKSCKIHFAFQWMWPLFL